MYKGKTKKIIRTRKEMYTRVRTLYRSTEGIFIGIVKCIISIIIKKWNILVY